MSAQHGWYYLHTNGSLIWKRFMPESSDFVRRTWPVDTTDRASAWTVLLEAAALGADTSRLVELAAHWSCDARDLCEFMARVTPNDLQRKGLREFIDSVLRLDPEVFFSQLAEGGPDRVAAMEPRA